MKRKQIQTTEIIHLTLANALNKIKTTNVIWTIARVEMSPDLRNAKIWIKDTSNSGLPIQTMNKEIPFFVEELKKTRLKYIPKLIFLLDTSAADIDRIDELINKTHES